MSEVRVAKEVRVARHRLAVYRSPHDHRVTGEHLDTRVVWADYFGGIADCRAALYMAVGVPLSEIDAASGNYIGGRRPV